MPDKDAESPVKAAETEEEGLAGASAALAKRWSDATAAVRKQTDTTAKLVASLGTTGVTAAGLAKFSDIFPLPSRPSGWQAVAIAGVLLGLIALAVAVGRVTNRLWRVSSPVFMDIDADAMEDLDDSERPIVRKIYEQTADLNVASSLRAYATRGHRFERVAERENDPEVVKKATADALQIRSDILATQARAATNVVRGRATDAIRGPATKWSYAIFLAGLLSFGVGADYLDSERSGRVATAKSCAEAAKAVRESAPNTAQLLPEVCGGKKAAAPLKPKADAKTPATARTETAGGRRELTARYNACLEAAKGDRASCNSLAEAVKALVP